MILVMLSYTQSSEFDLQFIVEISSKHISKYDFPLCYLSMDGVHPQNTIHKIQYSTQIHTAYIKNELCVTE